MEHGTILTRTLPAARSNALFYAVATPHAPTSYARHGAKHVTNVEDRTDPLPSRPGLSLTHKWVG